MVRGADEAGAGRGAGGVEVIPGESVSGGAAAVCAGAGV